MSYVWSLIMYRQKERPRHKPEVFNRRAVHKDVQKHLPALLTMKTNQPKSKLVLGRVWVLITSCIQK